MDIDVVDDDSPLTDGVLCSQGRDVGGLGRAEVSLFLQGVGAFDGEFCIQFSHVGVEGVELVQVVLDGVFDLILGILFVFQTPGRVGQFSTSRFRVTV